MVSLGFHVKRRHGAGQSGRCWDTVPGIEDSETDGYSACRGAAIGLRPASVRHVPMPNDGGDVSRDPGGGRWMARRHQP